MITFEDILKRTQAEGIPYNAIFTSGNPKKLVWGAWEILNTLYENKLDWMYESVKLSEDEYRKACDMLSNNGHVSVYCIRKHSNSYSHLDITFGLLCDDELKNTIELSGGFENFIKMGG